MINPDLLTQQSLDGLDRMKSVFNAQGDLAQIEAETTSGYPKGPKA